MIHQWKNGSRITIDPEKAYKEMSSLSEITPENVLNLARDETTELHDHFEWRDEVAGEKYRLIQARHLIVCMVELKEENKEIVHRSYEISSTPRVYKERQFFVINKDEYDVLLNRAKQELYALKKRYESIVELEDVFEAIDKL